MTMRNSKSAARPGTKHAPTPSGPQSVNPASDVKQFKSRPSRGEQIDPIVNPTADRAAAERAAKRAVEELGYTEHFTAS